jgi:hypothetical protein
VLIRKGSGVHFIGEDGKRIATPRGSSVLHDPAGTKWGKNSVLIITFKPNVRPATESEIKGAPRDYFGTRYKPKVGAVELPPRALAGWTRIGRVKRIYYTRVGADGGYYQHPFGERNGQALFRKGNLPVLYSRGKAMRLELGAGSMLDDRGFVYP